MMTKDDNQRDEAEAEAEAFELDVLDEMSRYYTAQFTAVAVFEGLSGMTIYLTDDERIVVHDVEHERISIIPDDDDVEEVLREMLDENEYIETMHALGKKPKVRV